MKGIIQKTNQIFLLNFIAFLFLYVVSSLELYVKVIIYNIFFAYGLLISMIISCILQWRNSLSTGQSVVLSMVLAFILYAAAYWFLGVDPDLMISNIMMWLSSVSYIILLVYVYIVKKE